MIRLIALFAFTLSSLAIASPGKVAISCKTNVSGLEKINFIETDLTGQYVIAQVFSNREVMVTDVSGNYLTTTDAEIAQSATRSGGVNFPIEDMWGMPAQLRIQGEKNMSIVVNDCDRILVNLSCERQ